MKRRLAALLAIVCVIVGGASTARWAPPAQGAFPGSNGLIAFQSVATTFDVFVMNPDGSGRTDLTGLGPNHEGGPAWSSEGSKIAFVAVSPLLPSITVIVVMNADASGVQALTDLTVAGKT